MHVRKFLALVAFAAMAAAGAGASAQEAETTADLRCLMVVVALSARTEGQTQNHMMVAALYYLGRLDGRSPDLDLETRIRAEILRLSPADVPKEAQRCGALMVERGQRLQQIGASLGSGQEN